MGIVTIKGHVIAITDRAILLEDEDGDEAWYSRTYSVIVGGNLIKGELIKLSMPKWLYDKANENKLKPLPTNKNSTSIPPDMLRRLIQLCHPDKHNSSQSAAIATEWLLKQRKQ